MNKSEIVAAVADRLNVRKTTAEAAVIAVLDTIQAAVANGDKVQITGFGAFEPVHKPARTARNPQTGQPIAVAESWAPKFRPGAEFKERVNDGGRRGVKAAA